MGGAGRCRNVSVQDALADFIGAMEIEGVKPVEPIAQRLSSGDLIRFRCDGDGRGRQNGWAILYLDERPAGAFGNYRLGLSRKWKSGDDRTLSPAERQKLKSEWAAKKRERADEQARCEGEAARDGIDLWAASAPAPADHPYAARKHMSVDGLRVSPDGRLLVPMVDASGILWNIQRIAGDGTKRFLKGGRTDGLFAVIGQFQRRGQKTCLGEGYATMAAVHRESGYPCIAAFSAKNLAAVARIWRDHRPDLDYIICADDDAHLVNHPNVQRNVGLKAAEAVALEIGARLAVPPGAPA